jgi:hypothetical protein
VENGNGVINSGYFDSMSISFAASGGSGNYTFTASQTYVEIGTIVDYGKRNNVIPVNLSGPDNLLPGELNQNGANFTFTDSPGIFTTNALGAVKSASISWSLLLSVTVSDGSQTVQCPQVLWSATINWPARGKVTGQASLEAVFP